MPYNLRLLFYVSTSLVLLGILFLLQPVKETNKITYHFLPTEKTSVLAGAIAKYWSQTNFTGGVGNGPFTIPWDTNSGWSNYASQSNTLIDGTGVKSANGNAAELISSIFDAGGPGISISPKNQSGSTLVGVHKVRGANSVAEIAGAPWTDSVCNLAYRYVQIKVVLPLLANDPVTKIELSKSNFADVSGKVVDSKTGSGISGASITVGGVTGKTNSSGSFAFNGGISSNGSYTFSASASGYQSGSKTTTWIVTNNGCQWSVPSTTIALTPLPSQTNTPPVTQVETLKTPISSVKIPIAFSSLGSSTTDITKLTDPAKVSNLTIEIPKKNKIIFAENVDLSSQTAADVFNKLDTYVKADKVGILEVDSKAAVFLNKKSTIYMYSLPYKTTPTILVDGKENPSVVSNITYKNNVLSFNAAHFTKFEAVAKTEETMKKNNNNQIIGLAIILFALAIPSGYLIFKKVKKQRLP